VGCLGSPRGGHLWEGVQGVQNVPHSAWVKTDVTSKTANATSGETHNGDGLVCYYGDGMRALRRKFDECAATFFFDTFYICHRRVARGGQWA
jgi:hypothetical protein